MLVEVMGTSRFTIVVGFSCSKEVRFNTEVFVAVGVIVKVPPAPLSMVMTWVL